MSISKLQEIFSKLRARHKIKIIGCIDKAHEEKQTIMSLKFRFLWLGTYAVITQVKSLRFANYFVETQHPSLPPTHCPDHDCFLQDTSSGNRITGTTGQSCPTQSPLGTDILCMQITNMLRLRSWVEVLTSPRGM